LNQVVLIEHAILVGITWQPRIRRIESDVGRHKLAIFQLFRIQSPNS
jgi:hypothetical protein